MGLSPMGHSRGAWNPSPIPDGVSHAGRAHAADIWSSTHSGSSANLAQPSDPPDDASLQRIWILLGSLLGPITRYPVGFGHSTSAAAVKLQVSGSRSFVSIGPPLDPKHLRYRQGDPS